MQPLTCPNCGKAIPSQKINIQKMVAVCPHCDHVFNFESAIITNDAPKSKRRKAKRPQYLAVSETQAGLTLAFRTNFRLDKDQDTINALTISGTFGLIGMLMLFGTRGAVIAFPFVLIALFGAYILALRTYNKTQIQMSDDVINVGRAPLPNPFRHINEVNLYDVIEIRYEETTISKKKQYDTPRYRVFAITDTGKERMIINDIIENYAAYIATTLQRRLQETRDEGFGHMMDEMPDSSRLLDDVDTIIDDTYDDDDLPSIGGLTQT